jgi:hypothetical protein
LFGDSGVRGRRGAALVYENEHFLLAQLASILNHRLKLPLGDPHVAAARELARVVEISEGR